VTKRRSIRQTDQTLSPSSLPSPDQPIEELRARWAELFERPPSRSFSRSFLAKAAGWKLQVNAHGDISATTRREMQRLVDHARAARKSKGGPAVEVPVPPAMRLKQGAQLIKVWRGTTYVVDVIDSGFRWEGSEYRSLSAVAKAITGTHWNGMIFFGLRERAEVERRRLARGQMAQSSPKLQPQMAKASPKRGARG
jgi:hypothetical protein